MTKQLYVAWFTSTRGVYHCLDIDLIQASFSGGAKKLS